MILNSTICEPGTKNLVGPLIDVVTKAFLDPEYFCENTLIMCHDGDYKTYHAEDYVNRKLSEKPPKLKLNNYVNKIYEQLTGQQNRPTLKAVLMTDLHIDF